MPISRAAFLRFHAQRPACFAKWRFSGFMERQVDGDGTVVGNRFGQAIIQIAESVPKMRLEPIGSVRVIWR